MKVLQSNSISAFGGINFVFEDFNNLGLDQLFNKELPELPSQSLYCWKDIIYSLYSIYMCGASCIEDVETNLKHHLDKNPFSKIPSPDTLLRRLSSLSESTKTCRTKRGVVNHQYCENSLLSNLNIKLLKKTNAFSKPVLTLDYDNTIVFNEKSDSVLTYKKDRGYQPGVCTINTQQVLYLENRNGNSDAKSFQHETLQRMFDLLDAHKIRKMDNFRAVSASYQYDVIKLLVEKVHHFYISARNSYVEKYYKQITNWKQITDRKDHTIWVGDIYLLPPKCKEIFVLSKFEGMKYKEISEQLNISIKTVENQMSIALSKLRIELRKIKKELEK